MWKRSTDFLACPICRGRLDLAVVEETDVPLSDEHRAVGRQQKIPEHELTRRVDTGLLLCHACRAKYPIVEGLPILLTYQTRSHAFFTERFGKTAATTSFDSYAFPDKQPAPGEEAVKESFSAEWSAYDYDGVIWELSYADHETRLLTEVGTLAGNHRPSRFLEVGCGIGLTTLHAQRNFGVDAVGVDLSSAPGRAAAEFKENPFLHFVQASVFALPFDARTFDIVYSRGVLHHTYSTEEAFKNIASRCRPGGICYLWVYGPGSIKRDPLRRVLYALEIALRPLLSRSSATPLASLVLAPFAVGYWLYNRMRRLANPRIQRLNFKRAMHAARDRFTPRFAHRHSAEEVSSWFRRAGFERITEVDWRQVPDADHADFGRNTAVRGTRSQALSA